MKGLGSTYVLSSWFILTYPVRGLAGIFSSTSILVVVSIHAASLIASWLGNLRTMVYTHLLSNGLLVAIPLAGGFSKIVYDLFVFGAYRKRFR